jgi:hypothetical protein
LYRGAGGCLRSFALFLPATNASAQALFRSRMSLGKPTLKTARLSPACPR